MGDADCTYDFRQLKPFVDKFHEGYEFVMGSRFRGYIEPGSMPPHHRYFGTPRHDVDPQPRLLEQVLRHPLRHARAHARRAPSG